MVTHYFVRKNIPLAILVGLIISTFVLSCGKILEGASWDTLTEWDKCKAAAEKMCRKKENQTGQKAERHQQANRRNQY